MIGKGIQTKIGVLGVLVLFAVASLPQVAADPPGGVNVVGDAKSFNGHARWEWPGSTLDDFGVLNIVLSDTGGEFTFVGEFGVANCLITNGSGSGSGSWVSPLFTSGSDFCSGWAQDTNGLCNQNTADMGAGGRAVAFIGLCTSP